MKKSILALAALAFMAWGCSSSDDETKEPEKPTSNQNPPTLEMGTDARPSWQVPNFDLYEQVMNVEVVMQDVFASYVSDQDLLCATANGEVRGVATPRKIDTQWMFPLVIASNVAGEDISLSYYCDKLKRIFTIDWTTFDTAVPPTGTGGIYQPVFFMQ